MRTFFCKKAAGGIVVGLFSTLLALHAQQRAGGFGGGGFGGFGGGGFGGGGFGGNRGGSSTTSGSYNGNGQVGNATFAVDPDTHTITVVADEDTAQQIAQVINSLDQPKRQVLIKVVFLEVDHNDSLDLGLQGGWTGPVGNNNVSAQSIQSLSQVGQGSDIINALGQTMATPSGGAVSSTTAGSTASTVGGGFAQIVGKDFQVTLQAIAQAGKSEVLSRPSIMARDGQLAEIVSGQSIYLPTGVTTGTAGTTGSTLTTINGAYQNVGIQLDVTPFIGANNMVEMILEPQDTAVDTASQGQVISSGASGTIFAPNIDKSSANTVVVTPDAQTVVIGGLISNNKSINKSQVPLLGDIPLLGDLFKHTSTTRDKKELVIFITPHIIQAPEQLGGLYGSEKAQASSFVTNSFTEKELDQFLQKVPTKKTP
jgi:general secretion pathway protein D